MNRQLVRVRRRLRQQQKAAPKVVTPSAEPKTVRFGALQYDRHPLQPVKERPKTEPIRRPETKQRIETTQRQIKTQAASDARVQHELRELEETRDLRQIDDDVEVTSTLFEWRAVEHNHRPKSATWYMILAGAVTVTSVGFLLTGNIIGGITIALAGALTYYIAQQEPAIVRYRLMAQGVAMNETLYHYRDLEGFNVIYEPGHTKTVIFKSKRTFSPLLHMEIGNADPVAIRDILLEFVPEDQDLLEPLVDIYARRLGF